MTVTIMEDSEHNDQNKPFVVGVGASAGGLEALELFFKAFPTNTGLIFVVIQHLSPDFKSLMSELLARHTKMKIHRVIKKIKIQPDSIYLVSPRQNLSLEGRWLIPSIQDESVHLKLPIDNFFTSLAHAFESNAVGVILSGTGSDGTKGCASIKEQGGLVIAQDPSTCKFDGMPNSIVRSGLADRILAPQEMAASLVQYWSFVPAKLENTPSEEKASQFSQIVKMLTTVDGIDFSFYRPSTIERRLERRLKVNEVKTLGEYVAVLKSNPTEVSVLHAELLIGVTKFFRDKEAFEYFESEVVPLLVKNSESSGVIRVWVVACSTGEEAYSIAMCLLDYLESQKINRTLKIFASDVDKGSLSVASNGNYSESAAQDIPPARLSKYFKPTKDGYTVTATLRKCIIFSSHNISKDPPFISMDLISCRNLLIYFLSELQARTLSLFHFALSHGGYLFLGKSESLGDIANEFDELSGNHKIFKKLRDVRLGSLKQLALGQGNSRLTAKSSSNQLGSSFQPSASFRSGSSRTDDSLTSILYEKLLESFIPACLVVDSDFELQHVFGEAGELLKVKPGKRNLNIIRMLPKEFSLPLSTALARCKRTGEDVEFKDVRCNIDGQDYGHQFMVKRVELTGRGSDIERNQVFAVAISKQMDEQGAEIQAESFEPNLVAQEQIENLETQLAGTKESLQTTIEELETTNEELQSTNEELMSSNEELQSSNEELQSINEELYTVNAEHQQKIDEVTELNSDLDFLLKGSGIGTLFLDSEFKVKRYNNSILPLVNLMNQDVGRSISHITFNGNLGNSFVDTVRNVIEKQETEVLECEIDDVSYMLRIVPHNPFGGGAQSKKSKQQGAVVTLIEVPRLTETSELKRLYEDAEEFNYAVAHDLQIPLRKINAESEEISNHVKDEGLKSQIEKMKSRLGLLSNMLDVLLKYSRFRTRARPYNNVDLLETMRRGLELAQSEFKNPASVEIVNFSGEEFVSGDKDQLVQLFQSLFTNSIESAPTGEAPHIRVKLNKSGMYFTLSIADQSKGIATEKLDQIFNLFDREELSKNSLKLRQGLPLAKRIINRHGGKIDVKSTEGEGTEVILTFPQEDAEIFNYLKSTIKE